MRWRLAAGGLVFVAAGFVAAGVLLHHFRGIPTHTTTSTPITTPVPKKQNTSLPWPTYGADNARTRAVTAPGLRPPLRPPVWKYYAHNLLELPPVLGYGTLYEEIFNGLLVAIDPATGEEKWRYDSKRCGWSTPALGGGLVFATFMGDQPNPCSRLPNGGIVALDAQTGKIQWSRNIAQSESSPLFAHGIVYFGTTNGLVRALSARTGKDIWSFDTGGQVKGSPALVHGRIFIGDYGGSVFALNAHTGKEIWRSSGHGNFYAGPSVVNGRVYVGDLTRNVYAFSARTGARLWTFSTGGYVYASTAVWRGIVLVGSYDHNFYAINGGTGSERWQFRADGPISGSASVINGIVYFSTLTHTTYAVNAATGRLIRKWNDGDYSPAVAGGGRLFLIGFGRIYALEPRKR